MQEALNSNCNKAWVRERRVGWGTDGVWVWVRGELRARRKEDLGVIRNGEWDVGRGKGRHRAKEGRLIQAPHSHTENTHQLNVSRA